MLGRSSYVQITAKGWLPDYLSLSRCLPGVYYYYYRRVLRALKLPKIKNFPVGCFIKQNSTVYNPFCAVKGLKTTRSDISCVVYVYVYVCACVKEIAESFEICLFFNIFIL